MNPKKLALFLWILIASLITGCWDMRDIDQRSFVLGVAFDKAKNGDLIMTLEIPLLANLAADVNEGGGGEDETSVIVSTTGTTPAQMAANFDKRFWRPLFFGHTKVIIISEEVARDGLSPFIDFFDRNPQVDRRLKLLIARDQARDVFNVENPREPIESIYINNMIELQAQTSRVITKNFQDSLIHLQNNGNVILPRVRSGERDLVTGGAAVIKDWKFISWLGENETRAVQFLSGEVRGGRIMIPIDDIIYTYTILTASTQIKPQLDDNQLIMAISVKSEGNLIEVFRRVPGHRVQDSIDVIEKQLNQLITSEIRHLILKLQDLEVDAIGFGEMVRRRFPVFWRNHHENWDSQFFPEMKFTVEADCNVRRTGVLL